MDSARRELSGGRDSVAIEILQDWTEENMPSAEEEALLDSLQSLPRRPSSGAGERLWRVGGDVVGHPDSRMPLLGMFDVSRRLVVLKNSGAQVFGGLAAGTWLDGNRVGSGIDARADFQVGDSSELRDVGAWTGWTNANQLELGFSNKWSFIRKWDRWTLSHGPILVASWRRTRIFGWVAGLDAERWCLSGSFRWRQDPEWPEAPDGSRHPMDLARAGFQSTARWEFRMGERGLAFGPVVDADGRILIQPDRWAVDSSTSRSSSRRMGLECSPALWVKWKPTGAIFLRGELGWAWTLQSGGAPLDLSPYLEGPYLRLTSAWGL